MEKKRGGGGRHSVERNRNDLEDVFKMPGPVGTAARQDVRQSVHRRDYWGKAEGETLKQTFYIK